MSSKHTKCGRHQRRRAYHEAVAREAMAEHSERAGLTVDARTWPKGATT